jgi:hypothetical protein
MLDWESRADALIALDGKRSIERSNGEAVGGNPFAVYLYTEDVDDLAAAFGRKAEDKPWGMYEFGVSEPDETLVRIGWPTQLRKRS